MKATLLVVMLAACGSGRPPPQNVATAPAAVENPHATSLAEAMRSRGLTPIRLDFVKRESGNVGDELHVAGNELSLIESAGWAHEPAVFARRDRDGRIVIVSPRPDVIIDRHVDAGCLTFAGGRMWFERVTYRIPTGSSYGGVVPVAFDKHLEISDYSETQADGSRCPAPMRD
jgi:hypothetical protein